MICVRERGDDISCDYPREGFNSEGIQLPFGSRSDGLWNRPLIVAVINGFYYLILLSLYRNY